MVVVNFKKPMDGNNFDEHYCGLVNHSETYHIVILEHGITGNRKELEYVKQALERAHYQSPEKKNSKLVVHSAKCNEKRSLDGIEAGGRRLAEEINDVVLGVANAILDGSRPVSEAEIDSSNNKKTQGTNITLSIIGNSMGGLYARYALKDINWVVHARNGSYGIKKVVFPNLFVTIATPHLGVKNMLYIAIPQFLENLIARILGQSGRDLFRQRKVDASKQNRWLGWKSQDKTGEDGEKLKTSAYNDIIEEMSIDAKFLLPLSRFSKRVAYANAYGTDIAVSTATAAFLVDDNDTNAENISDSQSETIGKDHRLPSACFSDSKVSSHMLVDDHSHDRQMVIDHCIHKSFEKKRKKMNLSTVSFETKGNLRKFQANETHQGKQYLSVSEMARSLDSLGWRKVFVDLRPHVPSLWRRPDDNRDNLVNQFDESSTNLQQYDEQVQQPRGSFFSSSDLKRRLSGNGSDGWLPFGHSFIVASERDPIHRLLCKKVRPLVDDVIAEPLMRDILSPLEQGGAVARNCLKGE